MCFFVHYKHSRVKIARRDITVFKTLIFDDGFFSQHRGFEYLEGQSYDLNSKRVKYFEEGFDFKNKYWSVFNFRNILCHGSSVSNSPRAIRIETGFHSYKNVSQAFDNLNMDYNIVVEMVIPKNSLYYFNPIRNEYVSNKIRFPEQLKSTRRQH